MKKRSLAKIFCILFFFCIGCYVYSQKELSKESLKERELAYWQKNLELLTEYAPYSDYQSYMEELFYIDTFYPSYLQKEVEKCDLCAIVHIKETEPYNGKNSFLREAYRQLVGTMSDPDGEELTQMEVAELLSKRPYLVRFASEVWHVTVEVEEYLYDRTGRYQRELPVKLAQEPGSGAFHLADIVDEFRAAKGSRLLLLLYDTPKRVEGFYERGSMSQLITEDGNLVPVNFKNTLEHGRYTGMQLADFMKLIKCYDKQYSQKQRGKKTESNEIFPDIPSGGILPWNLSLLNQQVYEYLISLKRIQNGERMRLEATEYPVCFQEGQCLSSLLEQLHQNRSFLEVLEWMECADREELFSKNWELGMVRDLLSECTLSLFCQDESRDEPYVRLNWKYCSFDPDSPNLTVEVYFQQVETEAGKEGELKWVEVQIDKKV